MDIDAEDPFPGFYLVAQLLEVPLGLFLVNIFVLLGLLFFSALVSGSEVAFFSLTSDQIAQAKASSNPADKRIVKLLEHPKRLLATILISNNLANIAFVTLSTFFVWQIEGNHGTTGIVLTVLTALASTAIVLFGEVVPKVYATHNNLGFARGTNLLLSAADFIFRPVAYLLMTLSKVIERRVETKGYKVSVDELHQALELTTDENTTEEEKGILKGIVNFGTLSVKQVMRSRMDITALDIETDFHELMDRINKCGFSRIPIYSETIDKIEGLLYIKDLLPFIESNEQFKWQTLLRPGFFIPENKKVDTLLKDFQEKRVHMAIVVDEYGGTSGLITLEDVIEEIVGEINDEFDDDAIAYNKLDENTYIFEARTSLNDFCKIIGEEMHIFDEVKGDSESLGGLLLELHSKMPRVGEKVNFDRFVFTVVSVDSKRIKRVRVLCKSSHEKTV